jgi:hypothetical protein
MPHSAALPFTFRRSDDTMTGSEYTSTRETVHGLLRLDGDALHIQWRASRTTDRVGSQIRTDHEFDPVRELSVPLAALADRAIAAAEQSQQLAGEGTRVLPHAPADD